LSLTSDGAAQGGSNKFEDRNDGTPEGYKDIALKFVKDGPRIIDPISRS
jgi:hypothetical protein